MTNENSYREKGRALFLAVMMVLSVVAMTAAFAGGAAAALNEAPHYYDDPEEDYNVGPTYTETSQMDDAWVGQEITFVEEDDEFDGAGVELHEGFAPSDLRDADDQVDAIGYDNGYFEVDTSELEEGYYHFVTDSGAENSDGWHGFEFEVTNEELDVEFDDDTVAEEGSTNLDFESERGDQLVNISEANGELDGEDLEILFDGSDEDLHDNDDVITLDLDDGNDQTIAPNGEIDAGDYEFEFEVTDSYASDNASLTVTDDDEDRYIDEVDETEQGDISNITIGVEETDNAVVTFGDYQDEGHGSAVVVEDIEYDNVTLQYNTYHADNESGQGAWSLADDDDAEEIYQATASELDGDALPDGSWDVGVGMHEDGFSEISGDEQDFADVVAEGEDNGFEYDVYDQNDRDNMLITERSAPGDAVVETAPEDDSVSDLDDYKDSHVTATDVIATPEDDDYVDDTEDGDSMFVSVDDFGANGSAEDLEDYYDEGEELFEATGISVEIAEQESGAVGSADYWNSSGEYSGDEALDITAHSLEDADDYEGDLIIEIHYDDAFEVDEEYDVYFNVSEEYPGEIESVGTEVDRSEWDDNSLTDEHYSDLTEVTFEEPEVEWDEIDELEAADDSSATGTTNVAPGSYVDAAVDSDEGNFIETSDANVSDDGTFEVLFDLEGEEVDVLADLEVDEPLGVDDDDTEVMIVEAEDDDDDDDDDDGISLDVDYDDIEEGEDAHIDATVDNNADNETAVDVVLEINDEEYNETLDIDGDDSATAEFTVEGLDVGDHDFTVDADSDDDSTSYDGTLTVEEDGVDDDEAPDDEDDADDDDAPEDDDDDDDDDDDGTPGFGVAVALVALLSAAMLALRRQD